MQSKLPSTEYLEKELNRVKNKIRYKNLFKSTLYTLFVVIALSILVSTLIFSVLQIYGKSMEPTLTEGEIVVTIKQEKFKTGDIIAFYYNNKILIKRIIAVSSEWVNIDLEGNVYVNDELLEEFYIKNKNYGEVDIKFPYQVPENSYFVLGDQREISIDSRSSKIGTISKDKIIGKVLLKIWPIKKIKIIN